MSEDIEVRVQEFCDAHQNTIKFAIERNIIRLGNRMLGPDGKKIIEAGLRDLIPTIDNLQLPAPAYVALGKIITGITLVSVGAAYAEATKTVVINRNNRDISKQPRSKDRNPIRIFIKKRINRNKDISNDEMLAALDSEAESGTEDGNIEFSDDKAAFVGLDKDGNQRFHLARQNVPRTIFDLKKKLSGC
jgi:hypothetical protein